MPADTAALIRHACTRIVECRAVEDKFTRAQAERDHLRREARGHQAPTPHAVVTAETERRVWAEVLAMLGVAVPAPAAGRVG
jgi:mannitol/fructose-specific phosphotransferase system IIA component